ncbi:hypothetical protein K0M31_010908 [Melipona bicolor]|uniref:Uncharacterized protein n=1 Tax=Melipona bicolor TaxID=60889 RepID=A0AA40KHQ8_9HYME|nr:hypothetical protein K0M31_010908 [Melipona bicolor]
MKRGTVTAAGLSLGLRRSEVVDFHRSDFRRSIPMRTEVENRSSPTVGVDFHFEPGDAVPCFLTSHSECDVWNVKKYGSAPSRKKCTAEENGRDENGRERERRESLEGDSRSAVEIKNRTYGHQHISINEFSGYRVYFRSGPATGVAANYNRFQQNDLRILRPILGIYCAE